MRHVESFFSKLKIVIHIIKINQSYYFHLSLIIFSVSYFIFIAYIWLLYIYHTITHWKKIHNIFSFKTYTTNKKYILVYYHFLYNTFFTTYFRPTNLDFAEPKRVAQWQFSSDFMQPWLHEMVTNDIANNYIETFVITSILL